MEKIKTYIIIALSIALLLAGTNQPPVSGVAMYNKVVMPSNIYTRQYVSAGQWAKTVVQKSGAGVFYLLIVERGNV